MAALVLSVAGGAVGGLFGPVGAIAGRLAGALVGNMLDHSLLGGTTSAGPRLSDLDVMASTEGAPIPRVYGRARLSGQVIWATPLEEVATTQTTRSGGKGGALSGPKNTNTTYSYFANLAVGLCEGEIGHVGRIWANGKLLDTSGLNMRVYSGEEEQAPDDLIVVKEGAGNAPAYRGLAYIVFERLPLADFNNRIPQLSFEIIRPVGDLEQQMRAVTLIPGTTEFGYAPDETVRVLGKGVSTAENRHVTSARSDVVAALDELQALCPNLQRVAIVVAWFGDDLRAGQCTIRPGVENSVKEVTRFAWNVNGVTRDAAYVVSQVEGRPAYGGTPSDDSLVHLIQEVKARGLQVTLYPFVMMDVPSGNAKADPWTGAPSQPAYPWRGRIACDPAPGRAGTVDGSTAAAAQVNAFFAGGSWNYRRMILHYANLVAPLGVESFLIGSELRALTRVRSASGVYPAVQALVTLAQDVKTILGSGTIVTYGADWTEYGSHVIGSEVRFPLDPLWASSAIDAIGIDYYAPLADWRDEADHLDAADASSIHDRGYLKSNVNAGESYDWYYADDAARAAQDRTPITDGIGKPWMYRAKDLWNWWSRPHVERVGGIEVGATGWVPKSKPIWLTEAGCPAVDKGANQPSVFPDPKSSENFYPYFSNGSRDDLMQRRYCEALLEAFDPANGLNPVSPLYGGRMIDVSAIHLWTWDARPYPVFPAASDVWADAANWQTGHWLTGRLGGAPLDALMRAILGDCGVEGVSAEALTDICDGYVVDRPMSPRAAIEPLLMMFAFAATGAGGGLAFVPRGGEVVAELDENDLVDDGKGALSRLTRAQETELPREISFGFTDALGDYRRSAIHSRRLVGGAAKALHADFALVTNDAAASRRAEIYLQDLWAGRETLQCALGPDRLALQAGDVIGVTLKGRRRLFQIDETVEAEARQIKARSIDPEVFALPQRAPRLAAPQMPDPRGPLGVDVLDLPVIATSESDVLTRLAIFAQPWSGATIWSSADGAGFSVLASALLPATTGMTLDALPSGPLDCWDRTNNFRVQLGGGVLKAQSDEAVFAGGNALAVETSTGAWEILQFAHAELVGEKTWKLSRLLRGQAGSEGAMVASLAAGANVVLLDASLVPVARGQSALERPLLLRIAPQGVSHDDPSAIAITLTPRSTALMPLAPVHLRASRQGDGVHVSWIRRTRIEGDSWSGEVPLGEESEAYRLDVMSGASVVRSIPCAASQAIYGNADEIADFGVPQASLTFRVAQMSAAVGAGRALQKTLSF